MGKLYSVYDIKAEVYSPPFVCSTKGLATRMFSDLVNDKSTSPGKYPADFKLVEIGRFDEASGVVAALVEFESLGFGTEYVNRE